MINYKYLIDKPQAMLRQLTATILALLLFSGSFNSFANGCNIELHYGILITPENIRIIHRNTTKVQINHNKQLFINGQWLRLEPYEQILLMKYSEGLRAEVSQIVGIGMEGAEIGLAALDKIMRGIAHSEDADMFAEEFNELRARFKRKFNHSNGMYYIAPQNLADLNDYFEQELLKEVKNLVNGSLGSVFVSLGVEETIDEHGDHGDYKPAEQLALLEQSVKQQLRQKAPVLHEKAEQFCKQMIKLDKTERELQVMLPRLRRFDVLKRK